MNPTQPLRADDRVLVTVTFAHAGTVDLSLPVVALYSHSIAPSWQEDTGGPSTSP